MKVSDAFRKAFRGEEVEPESVEESEGISSEAGALNKVLLITQDGCQGCDLAEEYLKEEIADGSITVCPLGVAECSKIADKLHLHSTPSIVSVDKGGINHKCDIRTEGDDFLFECPVDPSSSSAGVEKAPPPKHGKAGKLGIACISNEIKNQLGWQIQADPNFNPEVLTLLGALPECESGVVGFSEIKKGGGATTKAANPRMRFMRDCLKRGEGVQAQRMKRCSEEWRNMSEKEKNQFK